MSIFKLLYKYQELFSKNNYFKITESEILINNNNFNYLTINDLEIKLFGIDISSKLINSGKKDWSNFDQYFKFITTIKNSIIKLNHLGFGYQIDSLEGELTNYKNHLTNDFELVEEQSDDEENNRWYFVKHKIDRSVPKIELIFYLTHKYKEYCPQFQLDIDTDLSYESIKKITDEFLGKNFFTWKYNVPGYGIVMAMGKIGQINGVNILVGIGTNLRKQQSFKNL